MLKLEYVCEISFKWDRISVISMRGQGGLPDFDSLVLLGGWCAEVGAERGLKYLPLLKHRFCLNV